ncbi:MAG: hypothetical protein B9S33_12440 [Pedosphaera sp. Tous-C6FEB]|nr:MAG: hypothetical protein B9S33_12440 [Pedosphaera sp. Tous-C6FEB]
MRHFNLCRPPLMRVLTLTALAFTLAGSAPSTAAEDKPKSSPTPAAKAGAPSDWWSLKPLVKPTVPQIGNPIDAFIRAKLAEKQLHPAPEAEPRVLIRRLYFDLLGLPPKPEEVEAFEKECGVRSADFGMGKSARPADSAFRIPHSALERLVDRLLASPHYGERWARHWLDIVHYGDTHGYDKDKPRNNAWPYRDYVIRAFNEDRPYGRFIQEQVAGDVLFPGTRDGVEALGFIAAGPWDFIGHAEVPESKIDGKIARHLDRDDMVVNTLQTFNSLTVGCAQCHDHKFDPIPQRDYYRLHAVFAALDRADKKYFADAKLTERFAALEHQQRTLTAKRTALEAKPKTAAGKELEALDKEIEAASKAKGGLRPEYGYHSAISPTQEAAKWVQVDLGRSVVVDRVVLRPCYDEFNKIGAGFGFPVRFKIEASEADFAAVSPPSPPRKGGEGRGEEVRPAYGKSSPLPSPLPARASQGEGVSTKPMVIADKTSADFTNPGTAPQTFKSTGATARYVRITATKLAQRQTDYILALAEMQVFDSTGSNVALKAAVTALDSIEAAPRWRKANLTDDIAPPTDNSVALAELRAKREALLAKFTDDKSRAELAALAKDLEQVAAELKTFPKPDVVYAGTVHYGSGSFAGTGSGGGKPRVIQVLHRGDVKQPREEAPPGAPSYLTTLPGDFALPAGHSEGERRAALAKWLSSPDNPLTWRSIVNRVWQYHFGRGLVETPNDFGRMGALPTHPELLDWLAVEFRDGGGSLKKLHRLIVTSATYRQSSSYASRFTDYGSVKRKDVTRQEGTPDPMMLDANNSLLWRQNRRKLDAEAVRDATLYVAGKLDPKLGGPAFQDFIIEKPEHSPHYQYHLHDPEDPKSHRRSVYRFLVRSKTQPFMTALDCADPSMQVGKRNESVSALQALALLNNGLMVTMSKHFAAKLDAGGGDLGAKVDRAFREALARGASPEEKANLTTYAQQRGLANACRVLLNLNEFTFVD